MSSRQESDQTSDAIEAKALLLCRPSTPLTAVVMGVAAFKLLGLKNVVEKVRLRGTLAHRSTVVLSI